MSVLPGNLAEMEEFHLLTQHQICRTHSTTPPHHPLLLGAAMTPPPLRFQPIQYIYNDSVVYNLPPLWETVIHIERFDLERASQVTSKGVDALRNVFYCS